MSSYQLTTQNHLRLNSLSGKVVLSGSHVECPEIKPSVPLALAYGGLGASYADKASFKTDYNLSVGSDVQAHHVNLDQIAALEPSEGQVVKYVSGAFAMASDNNNSYVASTGLSLSGGEFSLNVDNSTVEVTPYNLLQVKNCGIDTAQLKHGAVSTGKLADGCVTNAKVADGSLSFAKVDSQYLGSKLSVTDGVLNVDLSGVPVLGNSNVFRGDMTLTNTEGTFMVQSGTTEFNNSVLKQTTGNAYQTNELAEVQTTNNTVTAIMTKTVDSCSVQFLSADVACYNSQCNKYAKFTVDALVNCPSGTATIAQCNVSSLYKSDSDLDVSVSVSGNQVFLNVAGLDSVSFSWVASFKNLVSYRYD